MGRGKDGQGQFFYSFDLDKVVPPDHLVRQIDGLLDLSWVHKELAAYYSHTGRPSIDPVLMIRMLIVGYVFALRSERRLCAEVQVNLAYRWFCKLGIEDRVPDHRCRATSIGRHQTQAAAAHPRFVGQHAPADRSHAQAKDRALSGGRHDFRIANGRQAAHFRSSPSSGDPRVVRHVAKVPIATDAQFLGYTATRSAIRWPPSV